MQSLDSEAVRCAAQRIAPHAHITPVLRSRSIDHAVGATVYFKAEHLQRGGAFKFRGACNAVWSLSAQQAARGVVTHSSGNHGAALALAATTRGIPAHIIAPSGIAESKLAAIAAYGATIYHAGSSMSEREQVAADVTARTGAHLVHPFTDPQVIAGQGTAARELLEEVGRLDAVLTPVGGGGLVCGTALAVSGMPGLRIFAAEPEGAADAFQSMRRGERVTDFVADTVADGLRVGIGDINFALMQHHAITVLPVSDAEIIAAMRMAWMRLKQVIEPSAATVVAALLRHARVFAGMRVGVILTGGNVDLDALPFGA